MKRCRFKQQERIVLRQLLFVMDWYGASIISDMQPRITTQGRIRDTPFEKRWKLKSWNPEMGKAETLKWETLKAET